MGTGDAHVQYRKRKLQTPNTVRGNSNTRKRELQYRKREYRKRECAIPYATPVRGNCKATHMCNTVMHTLPRTSLFSGCCSPFAFERMWYCEVLLSHVNCHVWPPHARDGAANDNGAGAAALGPLPLHRQLPGEAPSKLKMSATSPAAYHASAMAKRQLPGEGQAEIVSATSSAGYHVSFYKPMLSLCFSSHLWSRRETVGCISS